MADKIFEVLPNMKRPKIVCGWGCIPDPADGAYDAPPDTLFGHPLLLPLPSMPLTAVVGHL